MNIVSLDQRTPEWHRWRLSGITATEGAVITGRPAFGKSPLMLWKIKTGLEQEPDISAVPQVRYGVLHEDECREAWESRHDDIAVPVCGECSEHPLFRASFDGLSSSGIPVECKCPSEATFREAREKGTESELYARYWPQVQHQMLVAEAPYAWLCVWHEGEYTEFRIPRDDAYIAELIEKGTRFWKTYVEGKKPPEADPVSDVYVPKAETADLWKHLAKEFIEEQKEIDELGARMKAAKARQSERQKAFRKLMGDFRTGEAEGVRVTVTLKQGAIDTDRLLERVGMTREEADAFRRAPTEQIRVTVKTPS